ncbi:MAG: DNA polymerase III subunit gamma/tau [Flavobacteriales bacterium]|nr:DNA polymerase III subunit gamma/tau [Flavobacteriales bacterium]|tara:strand:- start:4372 stop:6105 length:1734 start_codon:yes stop_codon:yes gene_type:complete
MSDFIVSARKYRPTTFDSVVGQLSITSTLKNAIRSNQLAQSFLFCGPRGVGKTSCARILAKTINCESITKNIESCDKCLSCKSFNENTSFNIHELDAASNNSVDDIRKLVDQVRFAPQVGEYNIYIIDEVHMLSSQAFNAFLKTLEEPPKHAKFILATTEKNKIIPTILSRCQIFDFRRILVKDIANHLDFVAKNEGVEVEKEALNLIAQKVDGAMRDSLSLFDTLISFSDNNLTYKSVIEHLNILDYDYYFRVTTLLLKNDIEGLLNIFNEILENGFEGIHFINGLAEHLRDLLVSQDESTIKLLEKGENLKSKYLEQSKECNLEFLIKALDLCNECDVQYKTTNNQRLLIELTLMRISSIGINEKKKTKTFVVSLNDKRRHISVEEIIKSDKKDQEIKETSVNNKVSLETESKIRPAHTFDMQKKPSLISINSSLNIEDQIFKEDSLSLEIRGSDFSESRMLQVWGDLISFIKKQGKSNLGITLGVHQPILLDEYLIELRLSNSAQQEIFLEEKLIVLRYLRDKLENDRIEIKTIITELDISKNPYTNKDKFKKMLKENPSLDKLRVKLALDPDY